MSDTDERMRILKMIESGQLRAEDGARLLEALDGGEARERVMARTLRVRIADISRERNKVEVRIPVGLIDIGLKMGARLAPRFDTDQLRDLIAAVRRGATGRIFEVQDLDEGERIEVFVE